MILIGISSNLLHNLKTCICFRKNYKNGEFSPSHFWRNLTLKNRKKSNFDQNQLKISMQHKNMYMHQEKL